MAETRYGGTVTNVKTKWADACADTWDSQQITVCWNKRRILDNNWQCVMYYYSWHYRQLMESVGVSTREDVTSVNLQTLSRWHLWANTGWAR